MHSRGHSWGHRRRGTAQAQAALPCTAVAALAVAAPVPGDPATARSLHRRAHRYEGEGQLDALHDVEHLVQGVELVVRLADQRDCGRWYQVGQPGESTMQQRSRVNHATAQQLARLGVPGGAHVRLAGSTVVGRPHGRVPARWSGLQA